MISDRNFICIHYRGNRSGRKVEPYTSSTSKANVTRIETPINFLVIHGRPSKLSVLPLASHFLGRKDTIPP